MNINIKATNTTLTDAMRDAVENKLSDLELFLRPEEALYVELELQNRHHNSGEIFRAEIRLQPHGHYAEASAEDMYTALDLAIPKIKEQITREKDKRISLRRRLGSIFKRSRK